MGAKEAAARLRSAAGDLYEASKDLHHVATEDAMLSVGTIGGTMADLDTLGTALAAVVACLKTDGARVDLMSAREHLSSATDNTQAADGDDAAPGLASLAQGVGDADSSVEDMQRAVAEAATAAEALAQLLDSAKEAAGALLAQAEAIQSNATDQGNALEELAIGTDKIADALDAAVSG
jgi:methyl-accepting chemotaxis protein